MAASKASESKPFWTLLLPKKTKLVSGSFAAAAIAGRAANTSARAKGTLIRPATQETSAIALRRRNRQENMRGRLEGCGVGLYQWLTDESNDRDTIGGLRWHWTSGTRG